MCLLTFLPVGVQPDLDALANGATINDDGHGFALITGGRLLVAHGMDAEAMIEAFGVTRRAHPDGPALFHSRFGTHGDRSAGNIHPFRVGGDHRTVLAHNGILPSLVQPGKGDPRSDTRIVAEDFLPTFGSLRIARNRQRLARWMTPHNKIVVLTVDRRFKQQAYILNETSGVWDGGIWYSNDGYRPQALWTMSEADFWDGQWERRPIAAAQCGFCHGNLDDAYGECLWCGWCVECGEMPGDCHCDQYYDAPPNLDVPLPGELKLGSCGPNRMVGPCGVAPIDRSGGSLNTATPIPRTV